LKSWSGEAQLTGDTMDRRLTYAVGLTYFGEKGYDRSYSLSTRPGGVRRNNATRNYGVIDNSSYGVYSQIGFKITEALSFTGGLRYSHDRKGIEIRSANVGLNGVPLALLPGATGASAPLGNPCNATGSTTPPSAAQPNMRFDYVTGATAANDCRAERSDNFSALSWTAGLDYKFTPDILAYGKLSRGYRAGGQNLRAFNDYQFVPFKPETLTEAEIGLKSELLDRKVRFNVSAYRNILEDAQRNVNAVTNGISNTLITNAAKVRNIGFEADLTVRPLEGLSLGASGSYNKFKYLSYSDSTGDLTNTRPLLVPKYTLSLTGAYRVEVSDETSLTFNADYSLTGKMYADPCTVTGNARCWKGGPDATGRTAEQISRDIYDATTLPSAGIVNARVTLGLQDGTYTVSLWGRNLTNNTDRLGSTALVAPFRNYVSGVVRPPLMYGITAGMKF
jgi:iron complex outermembrane recepter protein